MTTTAHPELEGLGRYRFGWADSDVAGASARRGLSEAVVRDISARKNEPEWMLELRLKGLRLFGRKPLPDWGADLTGIDFENMSKRTRPVRPVVVGHKLHGVSPRGAPERFPRVL